MKLLLSLLLPSLLAVYGATDYTITDGYRIRFATAKAEGTFSDLSGTVRFDAQDLGNAFFDVSVATASIQTGNSAKDKHARGDSWLNADAHPRISFMSSEFTVADDGYKVTGNLSINGVTRTVTIPFSFTELVFTGDLTIDREEYGIDGPFLFGGLVGDEIAVSLRIPVE